MPECRKNNVCHNSAPPPTVRRLNIAFPTLVRPRLNLFSIVEPSFTLRAGQQNAQAEGAWLGPSACPNETIWTYVLRVSQREFPSRRCPQPLQSPSRTLSKHMQSRLIATEMKQRRCPSKILPIRCHQLQHTHNAIAALDSGQGGERSRGLVFQLCLPYRAGRVQVPAFRGRCPGSGHSASGTKRRAISVQSRYCSGIRRSRTRSGTWALTSKMRWSWRSMWRFDRVRPCMQRGRTSQINVSLFAYRAGGYAPAFRPYKPTRRAPESCPSAWLERRGGTVDDYAFPCRVAWAISRVLAGMPDWWMSG